ncbi:hypothetical protein B0H10DRAFT_1944564 [Mycena sp. CBHHK59/15]|nr:hypothetical protein B0H10DRAFT_1944564 [Mycena sp. CBHHK59/15]
MATAVESTPACREVEKILDKTAWSTAQLLTVPWILTGDVMWNLGSEVKVMVLQIPVQPCEFDTRKFSQTLERREFGSVPEVLALPRLRFFQHKAPQWITKVQARLNMGLKEARFGGTHRTAMMAVFRWQKMAHTRAVTVPSMKVQNGRQNGHGTCSTGAVEPSQQSQAEALVAEHLVKMKMCTAEPGPGNPKTVTSDAATTFGTGDNDPGTFGPK